MRFACGLLLVATAFLAAPAAPVPKNAKKTNYYPLAVGTKGEYVEGDDVKTTEVVSEKTENDARLVSLTYRGEKSPPPTTNRVFRVVGDEIFSQSTETSVAEKAGLIMKRVIRAGDAWTTEHQWTGGALWTISHKVGEAKKIKVPAGEYLALPVEAENSGLGKETRWYVDGIGFVRKEVEGKATMELKSFTAGK